MLDQDTVSAMTVNSFKSNLEREITKKDWPELQSAAPRESRPILYVERSDP